MTIDRTPKPCLHKRANHQHGDRLAYVLDRCRCHPCALAASDYERRRARLRAYGRGTPGGWVDAAPVREHVERIQAAGMGWKRVAEVAGVRPSTLSRLLYGKNGYPPSKRLNPRTAAALLAVPIPTVDQLSGGVPVEGVGTQRRLQALVALGWTQTELARRLGRPVNQLNSVIHGHVNKNGTGRVTAATARTVSALYDQLWDQVPAPGYGRSRARLTARQYGWVPPLAWDDETIDNPAARPVTGVWHRAPAFDEIAVQRAMHGDDVHLRPAERTEVARRLTALGYSAAEIAERMHTTTRSVQRRRAAGRRSA